MVLSCTSESWTGSRRLRTSIWLEDVLEYSRVAVGCRSPSPRCNFSCSLIHYMRCLFSNTPFSACAHDYYHNLSSYYKCSPFPFPCYLSVLFRVLHPRRTKDSLRYFLHSSNKRQMSCCSFVHYSLPWSVCLTLLSYETVRSRSVKSKGGFMLLFNSAWEFCCRCLECRNWFIVHVGFHLFIAPQHCVMHCCITRKEVIREQQQKKKIL